MLQASSLLVFIRDDGEFGMVRFVFLWREGEEAGRPNCSLVSSK